MYEETKICYITVKIERGVEVNFGRQMSSYTHVQLANKNS